jgi:hypothetical protein
MSMIFLKVTVLVVSVLMSAAILTPAGPNETTYSQDPLQSYRDQFHAANDEELTIVMLGQQ